MIEKALLKPAAVKIACSLRASVLTKNSQAFKPINPSSNSYSFVLKNLLSIG